MNILVTAGNTFTPIDRVRGITNVFTGRTGACIAAAASRRGHSVTLLTSRPDRLKDFTADGTNVSVITYHTYDDLHRILESEIRHERYKIVVHSAAVGDYRVTGIYAGVDGERRDVSADKVKGHHRELWLKLEPVPKLVDRMREPWGYAGVLVKFKLEVGVGEEELADIAERSRLASRADLMAANTYEQMHAWALVGPIDGAYRRVPRADLADFLLDAAETLVDRG